MVRKSILGSAVAIPLFMVAATATSQEALVTNQGDDELRGEWVIGADVTSPEGDSIGSIEDIILSQEDGTVTAAIVSVGGFLGIGAKSIAIEWSELQIDWDANEVNVNLTQQEAEDAPEYAFRERENEPAPVGDSGMGTGTGTGTGMDTGTGGTGAGTGSGTGMGTGADTGTGAGTEMETETEMESDTQTGTTTD